MSVERRILLLSRASHIAPVLRQLAVENSLQFVRAGDARSAFEELQRDRFACALFDLDTLGEGAEEFLSRVRGLRPELRAVGFGRLSAARPAAQLLGYPLVSKPLTRDGLQRALGDSLVPNGEPPVQAAARRLPPDSEAASVFLDASHEELRTRVAQLVTLYQIGRAISESRNWSEALDYFLATLRDYLRVQGAAILLYSRESTVLAPRTVLAMAPADVDACVRVLLQTYPVRAPVSEIHALDCYRAGSERGIACRTHAGSWHLTVLPLLFRRAPLGFLVLDKPYAGGDDFAAELFFLQTIQTILGEEVANAVHLSRLVDLKNFNETVLDNIESGVLTANERGEIGFVNRLARQILGLPPGSGATPGLHFDALFQAAGDGRREAVFHRILSAAHGGSSFVGELVRQDGRRVPVQLRSSRIRNPSDSELLVVVAFEDLTQQRLLQEQVRRTDRLRSLGELSAAIAHEVRNPLQGISLTLSNLKEHLSPSAESYVAVMFSEMERLNGLVGNILSFARPSPPFPLPTALHAVCERALELAAERAAKRGVRLCLEREVQDDLCEVDEGQILQVVLNIVLNAIDASPPGGQVDVRLHGASERLVAGLPDEGLGSFWRIEVHDQGPGISDADRDKLFDPFFTTKTDGSGLGLSVSQKIVEEHRGCIHVDSRPGSGTTFIVELPRRFVQHGTGVEPQRTQEGA